MCVRLAIVAKEPVKPLLSWIAGGPGVAQTPFAKSAGDISFLLQEFPNGDFIIRNRVLAFGFGRLVVAHKCVARVFASSAHNEKAHTRHYLNSLK